MCPIRRRGEWGDSDRSCLPPILSYTSETELRELERRRLRVEQLQQDIRLQKVSNHFDISPSYIQERPFFFIWPKKGVL